MPSPLTEYNPEWETFEAEASEWLGESSYEVLGETTELELATELLAVADERELDQFLGNLIRKIAGKVGTVVRSPLGRAIGRGLKGIIRKTLPLAGTAIGTLAGGPLGASIGSGLATAAGSALGLELEGLSHEDQELEAAKRFVHFASDAVKNATSASPSIDPTVAAHSGIAAAARRTAPGLLPFALSTRPRGADAANPIRPAEDNMHDIDRTQTETDFEADTYEFEQPGWSDETGDLFGEVEEMELASELMEIRDEQELDQFLGSLIRRAGRALGRLVRSSEGQAIGSILKGAARQMLPHAAGAVGAAFGGPLGARIGSGIASLTNGEMEMDSEAWDQEGGQDWSQEAWNQEDREFEGAKQFVRVAADTVRNAVAAAGYADPMSAAQSAIAQAAELRAPGLLQPAPRYGMGSYPGGDSGRWMRRGNRIVLFGV
jgi:uncharacterized protein (DUF697 family)